ncbi:MAG: GyrI-like domain-containing protein [Hyphomicrobiaceae bacterium]|nr:GyrI-like domain-containing protein [Hyphomicrobiaceae bacterium]
MCALPSGFVYLRALRVGAISVSGPLRTAAPAAWSQMCSWLERRNARHDVKVGYGLCWPEDGGEACDEQVRYDASIELPAGITEQDARDLTFQTLPGGAYARERYKGSLCGVATTLATLRTHCLPERGLAADPHRPVITVFPDTVRLGQTDSLRVDILMPVAVANFGRSAA